MTGLEYLTPDVLAGWWRDLDALVRGEIARASRRCAGLSARAQPPVAVRRPRDVPPGREQARPGTTRSPSWRRTPTACRRRARCSTNRSAGRCSSTPGRRTARRCCRCCCRSRRAAESSELVRRAGRFRRDVSPAGVVAARGVRLPQGDPALRRERADRPRARLVERPEAAPGRAST